MAADLDIDGRNCIAVDLCRRFKNRHLNYVTADSEIGNEELCHCQFRNRQPKIMLLPIQKSAVQNRDAVDDGGVIFYFNLLFFGIYIGDFHLPSSIMLVSEVNLLQRICRCIY